VPQIVRGAPAWAGVVAAAVLVIAMVPGGVSRARTERRDLHHERARTHEIGLLQSATLALGGARCVGMWEMLDG